MKKQLNKSGQILIALLVFMIIAMTIIAAGVVMLLLNNLGAQKFQQGNIAYYLAESGIEDALMRLLRNPSAGNTTLTTPDGTATETINGGTVLSTGVSGNFVKKIQVQITYSNNQMVIQSWAEVY